MRLGFQERKALEGLGPLAHHLVCLVAATQYMQRHRPLSALPDLNSEFGKTIPCEVSSNKQLALSYS